ncbi:MAG: hypothetical protein WC309_02750 [Candidatus Paceibacterota bacterium]|nr:hypothetical protein [Candidatus Omnitrophota bacterium]
MIIYWYIEFVFLLISLLDLRLMSFYELKYWAMLMIFGEKHPELLAQAKKLKDEASDAVSIAQFAFWYSMIGLSLAFIADDGIQFVLNLIAIIFFHWAGKEDLQYFILDVILKWLPESWWSTREQIKITQTRKLPKYIAWMIVAKKIGPVKIPMLWVRMFAGDGGQDGQDVKFWRFATGVIIAQALVIIVNEIMF